MSIYVPNNHINSELRCHGNLLTSPKTEPLCLRQVLVVRMSIIQTTFFDNIQVFMGHFLYNLPRFSAAVWHTQRMTNFVTIFRWRFIAPVWHNLYVHKESVVFKQPKMIVHPKIISVNILRPIHTAHERQMRRDATRLDAIRRDNLYLHRK